MPPSAVNKDDAFPLRQITVLAICRLAEPIAFTSILAYSFVMVQHLNGTDKDASVYSGLLVSAFAVAETTTIMFWGALSDRIGRKPVILMGLAGNALSSLIFGFAQKYWVALLARFLGGSLNGNLAVLQTMVSEIVKRPEHEPRAYAVQPFMWSLGTIIGTAMGGFLAEPAKYYPSLFSPDGLFGTFPYLLPNLVSAIFIFIAMIQGYLLLEETNPKFARTGDQDRDTANSVTEHTPLRPGKKTPPGSRRASMLSGSFPPPIEHTHDITRSLSRDAAMPDPNDSALDSGDDDNEASNTQPSTTFTTQVLLLVFLLAIFSFNQMESASIYPIWLLDDPQQQADKALDFKGGLGYTVHDVGLFMSMNGLLALFNQAFVFAPFVERVGPWKTIFSLTILYPLTYVITPFLSAVPHSLLPAGIVLVLGLQNLFHVLYYPCVLILLKNATPSPLVLGKVNGLGMAAACAARTVSPPLGGLIYSVGGSAAAWWSCSVISLSSIGALYWLKTEEEDKSANDEEEDVAVL